MQKNMRDQLIDGIIDGDTIKDLLQIKDRILDRAIQVCQAQEAAKKQRASITGAHQESVSAIRNPPYRKPPRQTPPSHPAACLGCGSKAHPGGWAQWPAFGLPCNNCHKLGHFVELCYRIYDCSNTVLNHP